MILILILIPSSMKMGQDYIPVKDFNAEKFLGTWYEIARFDHSFESGLDHVTAEYEKKENGMIKVTNRGKKNEKDKVAIGKAKFAGEKSLGHLKVSFFLFFYGDYIIIYLDDKYETAIVTSGANYLWFLSRSPEINTEKKDLLIQLAKNNGFNTDDLIWVNQK